MKANRILAILLSSAFVAIAAVLVPAPVAGVVRAETAVTAKETDDATEQSEEVQEEENLSEVEKAEREAEAARKALQKDPNHVHHFKWIAIMNESESAEGTINYMCSECDKIWYFRPISPYFAFQGSVARRIEIAPEGGTVRVKTSQFINFNKQVMEALSKRPDVSVYVSFLDQEYKGNRVSFVIPAGEDDLELLDDKGYAGFLYLGSKYGLTMEEPAVVEKSEDSDGAKAN